MGTVSITLPSDGTTAEVTDYNSPLTTIKDEINGNLDNDNIKAAAGIAGSKLADGGVTTAKLAANAATKNTTVLDNVAAGTQTITSTNTYTDLTNSSTTFTSVAGGDLVFKGSVSFFKTTAQGLANVRLVVGSSNKTLDVYINELNSYKTVPIDFLFTGIPAGSVSVKLQLATVTNGVGVDPQGRFNLIVTEYMR